MSRPEIGLFVLVLGAALACTNGGTGGGADDPEAPAHRYTVNGEIVALPDPARPDGTDLYLRHEAIPDFVGVDGATVGMEAMTMGFPLASGVDLAGLEVGDAVVFDFEVRWQGSPPLQVTRVERRDAGVADELQDDASGGEPTPEDPGAASIEVEHDQHEH